jgi:hypothetical protein
LMRIGLLQTTPRPGFVNRFKQLERSRIVTPIFEDEPARELATEVMQFVDQTILIDI